MSRSLPHPGTLRVSITYVCPCNNKEILEGTLDIDLIRDMHADSVVMAATELIQDALRKIETH
jgi:hypothetical protein